jgi:hypothetical protein
MLNEVVAVSCLIGGYKMIEWKKYDAEDPPQTGIEYIIFMKSGYFKIAELDLYSDGQYVWEEVQERISCHNVTHYAEINLPDEIT